MPWNYRPWGCGSGSKGSCNGSASVTNSPFWLQFEICDDGYKDKAYFEKVYKEACEFTAYLCEMFDIDPNGTVKYNGVTVPTILCHQDAYKLGLGSNHGDVLQWFGKYGKTMADVRKNVSVLMQKPTENVIYRVQVGAFKNKSYAETFLKDVKKHYPDAYITKTKKG